MLTSKPVEPMLVSIGSTGLLGSMGSTGFLVSIGSTGLLGSMGSTGLLGTLVRQVYLVAWVQCYQVNLSNQCTK